MAQFIVMTIKDNDVPALGSTGTAKVYRGDHATEPDAVNAAVALFALDTGARVWATSGGSLTRYTVTTTVSRSSTVG